MSISALTAVSGPLTATAASPLYGVVATIATGGTQGVAVNQADHTVWATAVGQQTVERINATTDQVTAYDIVGHNPEGVAVDPNTDTVYVANEGDATVSVVNGATNVTEATIPGLGGSQPAGLAVDASSDTIYVADLNYGLEAINGSTNIMNPQVIAGCGNGGGYGVAFDPTRNTIYATDFYSDAVCVFDGATWQATGSLPTGVNPEGVAVNPVTDTIYACNFLGNSLSIFNGATGTLITTLPVGNGPKGVAVDPTTNTVYVTLSGQDGTLGGPNSNTVAVIDGATNSILTYVPVGTNPDGVDVDQTTHNVYVANQGSNTMSVINQLTTPAAPTIGAAIADQASALVAFSPPSNDGGSVITSYTVTAADSTNPTNGGQTASGAASPITVSGLTDGDSYTFSVTATNLVGTGPASAGSNQVVPGGPPTLFLSAGGSTLYSGTVGETITLSGGDFTPNGPVSLRFYSRKGFGVATTATGNGALSATAKLPAGVMGTQTVFAIDQTNHQVATATFTMRPTATLSPASGRAGRTITLKVTGCPASEALTANAGAADGPLLGSLQTTAKGSGQGIITIPSGTSPGSLVVFVDGPGGTALMATIYTVK